MKTESEVAQSCPRLLATPWTAAYQAPPSMGFSRQEYWIGVPLPSPDSTLPSVKQTTARKLPRELGSGHCDDLDGSEIGEREAQEGAGTWIHLAGSLC